MAPKIFAAFAHFCGNCLGWEFLVAREEFALQQCKNMLRAVEFLRFAPLTRHPHDCVMSHSIEPVDTSARSRPPGSNSSGRLDFGGFPPGMRGRIARFPFVGGTLALGLLIAAAGCATPGPLHVYFVAGSQIESVQDVGPDSRNDVPAFLTKADSLTGMAYDPFTDHLFLRLAPGNQIRVVDRPARTVKREFQVDALPHAGGADLAIRPATGHIFLLHPREPSVIVLTRLGKWVRNLQLEGNSTPATGIAFDTEQNRLLVLAGGTPARITSHDLLGRRLNQITLSHPVGSSLGFDSKVREFYAPLAGPSGGIGVFDASGQLRRTVAEAATFVDVGPRSFLRMF